MGTQPQNEQNEVTQDQSAIDAQQDTLGQQPPQYVTMEQMHQLLGQQASGYERQIAGLQSKMDTGLNAIRRDTKSWAESKIADLQTNWGREQWLAGLNEEEQRIAKPLLDEIRRSQQPKEAQVEAPPQPAPQSADAQGQWQQIYQMVRNMGVDPQTPGIDYQILTNGTLQPNDREQKFYASVFAAKAKVAGVPPAPQAQQNQQPPRPQTANPPVQQGAAGRGAGYRNADDVRDAYIQGRISTEDMRKQMQPFGGT